MPNIALNSLRRVYEAVPEKERSRLENDFLEIARGLTPEMPAHEVGCELAWLESEIQSRRGDPFAEAHGVFENPIGLTSI